MSEKKVVSRSVAIIFGVIAIILAVGLVGAIVNYTSVLNNKDNKIMDLQNQIDFLKAPKLIKVDLKANDNRPLFGTPYLHIYGYICNVGTNSAYNCKLHIVAYQSGGVKAIDTYIDLGTIYKESWKIVDSKVYYSGSPLESWEITPEWTD